MSLGDIELIDSPAGSNALVLPVLLREFTVVMVVSFSPPDSKGRGAICGRRNRGLDFNVCQQAEGGVASRDLFERFLNDRVLRLDLLLDLLERGVEHWASPVERPVR